MPIHPLLSVIVPIYKIDQYLGICIESLIHQTYRNLEIILVDDGSPDRCTEICDLYARKDDRSEAEQVAGELPEYREWNASMINLATKTLTAPLGQTHLFSVGQAGFIIKSKSGQLLGIDLYLSECVERVEGHMGFKRLLPRILDPFDLAFDVVIATHPHLDHFDMDAMPQLMSNPKTKFFASIDCEKEEERLQMPSQRCTYVKPGDCAEVGDFSIKFTNCDHGTGAPDAVGVVVTVDGKKIFEAGDTCLRLDWVDAYKEDGPFDVLIAPINGAYGNLNEEDCVALSEALKPKLTIPCHYGMFASHGGNPRLFYRYAMEKGIPCLLMAMGEACVL